MSTTEKKTSRAWTLLSPKVLRKSREREGLSRKALAEKLGVSPGAVQNWESDASTPNEAMQQRLLDALKPREGADADVNAAAPAPAAKRGRPRTIKQSEPEIGESAAALIVAALIAKGGVSPTVECAREAFRALQAPPPCAPVEVAPTA